MESKRIKILVASNSEGANQTLANILRLEPHFEVVGVARNADAIFEMTNDLTPDIITLDPALEKLEGVHAVKMIMRNCPTPIVWVNVDDPLFIKSVESALESARSFKADLAKINYPNSSTVFNSPRHRASQELYSSEDIGWREIDSKVA